MDEQLAGRPELAAALNRVAVARKAASASGISRMSKANFTRLM